MKRRVHVHHLLRLRPAACKLSGQRHDLRRLRVAAVDRRKRRGTVFEPATDLPRLGEAHLNGMQRIIDRNDHRERRGADDAQQPRVADIDHAERAERAERLAYDRAADTELSAELPLARQLIADRKVKVAVALGEWFARFEAVLAQVGEKGIGNAVDLQTELDRRRVLPRLNRRPGLSWAVGIPYRQKVYAADVAMIFPVSGYGRPRQHHIPDSKSVAAEKLLAEQPWRSVSWRRGTKGRLTARFAAVRVRVADGPTQRIRDMGGQHLPGEEVWLLGEHRSTGERKYYLSNLPADTSIKTLAGAIKARWICEQAHPQLKEELGLDYFEGRSWTGLHRHALMTMIAYAFLQSRRLTAAGRKKESGDHRRNQACQPSGKPSSTSLLGPRRHAARIVTRRWIHPQHTICQSSARPVRPPYCGAPFALCDRFRHRQR